MSGMYIPNQIWTTGNSFNGFPHRPPTPGNASIRSTLSSQSTVRVRANGGVGGSGDAGPANNNDIALRKYAPAQHLIGVQSRFRRKYYHKVLLGILVLLIIILLVVIVVISVTMSRHSGAAVCVSKECVRTAASLLYSMDPRADPCEDFYQFTCGRWSDEHPRPDSLTSNDWFHEAHTKVMRTLRAFLQSNISAAEPEAVSKTKTMYKSCMDTETLDQREIDPLLKYLRQFEIPLVPSGLNLTLGKEARAMYVNSSQTFSWLRSVVHVKRSLGMDLIVGFDIFPDPFNRSINRVAFGTPETDSGLPFNNDESHKLMRKIRRKFIFNQATDDEAGADEEEAAKETASGLSAYVLYMKRVIELYVQYMDEEVDVEALTKNAATMTVHAVKVARRLYRLQHAAENASKSDNPIEDIVYLKVDELQQETDKLIAPQSLPIWREYLQAVMRDINHTRPFVIGDLRIITSQADISYLQGVAEYLQQTPAIHIEFYIWMTVVEELLLHTTSEMRLLHSEYMRELLNTEGNTPRSLYCVNGVNSLMGMAVSYALIDEAFMRHKLPNVQRMLGDIRAAFDSLVSRTAWMDAATKRETSLKSAEMQSFIGFPEWITNATALDEHYAGVAVNESTHLENMIGVLEWQVVAKLESFYEPDGFGWATAPSNVNAFHTFQANAITIPIAILQYPFYGLGLEAMNYGSIGTVLGHELTHGFDDSGRMFDKNGNMVQWWSNETIAEYVNRTQCFVDQYNGYHLEDIDENIDGELTLGENIADNGGMREAFYAYRLFVRQHGAEKQRLPGLEQFDHEQLFFMAFGNLWCESYTKAGSRFALTDSHCPGKVRLKGVLTNSEEFADTFKCPKGSAMNPDRPKCRIW